MCEISFSILIFDKNGIKKKKQKIPEILISHYLDTSLLSFFFFFWLISFLDELAILKIVFRRQVNEKLLPFSFVFTVLILESMNF